MYTCESALGNQASSMPGLCAPSDDVTLGIAYSLPRLWCEQAKVVDGVDPHALTLGGGRVLAAGTLEAVVVAAVSCGRDRS